MLHKEKNGMEFWLFRLNDPALYQFYQEQADNQSLYYSVIIQEVTRDFPAETRQIFHLYPNTVLLIKNNLVPIYYACGLQGFCIILTEKFALIERNIAMLKFYYFFNGSSGIIDFKALNEEQKQCLHLIEMEYAQPYDDEQAVVLRNLMISLMALSSVVDYDAQVKEGHLLTYALQCIDLIEAYAFQEKKITFYANRLKTTTQTLTQALEFIFKKSFKEILSNYLIIKSIYLLVFTPKNITQIAHEMDFDTSHFIRFFTERKGMHPKVLRESYRKTVNEL